MTFKSIAGVFGALALASALSLAAGVGARAEDVGDDSLPKTFKCSFTSGASWSYDAGTFQSKPPNPLAFSIEDIDLEKQSATLKTQPDGKSGKLSVVRAINANHFLEVVNEGFLNLTTIYDKDTTAGKYPAVHSRHFGLLGQPVFGQYTGFCTAE
ncbi:hypothetical protein [Hyphomicrobium sp.]|uniref:hypothetical protein n=1 Tax=Hyphomicrobium sp. TaxID=82 RepID=UPI002E31A2B5|nr:hypothetical protein [Hyphomicrobium sp.]HEX2843531.1 hypothetical protein [Hyphomicrobium sp.]